MSITFLSHFLPRNGYGYPAMKIAEALRRLAGADVVEMRDTMWDENDPEWHVDGPGLIMSLPEWWRFVQAEPLVGLTMHETTELPAAWVRDINRAESVIVPCEYNRQVFVGSGVTVPVHVARWGIDPEEWYPLERPRQGWEPYTFLWSGNGGADHRKGWDVAYRAFRLAFGDRADVRLILHFRQPLTGSPEFRDENVETLVGMLDLPAMRGLFQCADVFVFPSRGEGWGLPPREAAATGLPALVTRWGGLAESVGEWALGIPVGEMMPAHYGLWKPGEVGEWPEPDLEATAELLVWCEAHRASVAAFGAQAADWLRDRTWDQTGMAILDVFLGTGAGL
jgi:glycosyltransferase involved in cell wall biosynthesis